MKLFIGLIILCIAVSGYGTPRIVGGHDAPVGRYPYQVSLQSSPNKHICGGSILNRRWILTAASCLQNRGHKSILVIVGTNRLNDENSRPYLSEYVAPHPDYGESSFSNDVGLIRVHRDIEYNDKVLPIRLPLKDFTKENYPAVLTGWGNLKYGGVRPDYLQEITLTVISQEQCKRGTSPVRYYHICTLTRVGEGACNGDAGSPLVADGDQIGIVSFGVPCARGRPDVYTRVFSYLSWIEAEQNKF